MPFFRRRHQRRRTNYRRRSSPKKYFSKRYPVRKAIVSVAKKVKTLQKDVELKCITTVTNGLGSSLPQSTYSNALVSSTLSVTSPQPFLLNGCPKGVGQAARIGDDIRVTSVHLSGQVYMINGGTTLGANFPVRIMLVSVKRPRGSPLLVSFDNTGQMSGNPALSGLFNVQGSGNPTTWAQLDTKNAVYNDYKVHYDRTYKLHTEVGVEYPTTASTIDTSVNPYFNFHIKKKLNLRCDLSRGNNATWTDFEKNELWVLFLTDTNSNLGIALDSNCYFKDA